MQGKERLLIDGYPHHLVRKSRDNQVIFHDDSDYLSFLNQIRELRDDYELKIHAWCLLPDKVHILVTPPKVAKDLSLFMKALSCRASLRRKEVYKQPSPWDPRYRSSPVEPRQWLLACMSYIEQLPVLHRHSTSAYQYRWSSYRMRLGKTSKYWLDDPEDYILLGNTLEERAKAFSNYLRNGLDEKETNTISGALTRNGLTGSPHFAETIKKELDIEVPERRPRGRPRKYRKKPEYWPENVL